MSLPNCDGVWEQAISFGMLPNTSSEFNFATVFDSLDMQIFCLKTVFIMIWFDTESGFQISNCIFFVF